MEEKEYLEKILKGEELSEGELSDLVWDYEVESQDGEHGRWHEYVKTIVELDGKYFAIDWARGLTEMQEHEFNNQPYEVKKVEKMVKVTEWVKTTKGESE